MLWSVHSIFSLLLLPPHIFPLLQCGLPLLGCSPSEKSALIPSGNINLVQCGLSPELQGISDPSWVLLELQGISAPVLWNTISSSDLGVSSAVFLFPAPPAPACPLFFLSQVFSQRCHKQIGLNISLQWVCLGRMGCWTQGSMWPLPTDATPIAVTPAYQNPATWPHIPNTAIYL